MELSLSNQLGVITEEINFYKQQAGQAVFEIGRRLKHVRDNEIAGSGFKEWAKENCEFEPETAYRFIKAYEQFGKVTTSSLPTGKLFEMLSLPESIDRKEFIEKPHTIPSSGEQKTVDEMTVKELREVKKQLQDAKRKAAEAEAKASAEENSKYHYMKLLNQAKNQPPQVRVETKTVEVVPDHIKRQMEEKDFQLTQLRHGYQEAKQKLKEYETRNTTEFDEEEARKLREKLQHEADINTINMRLAYKQFIEKAAITSFLHGAIATSSESEKQRLAELVESAEQIINQTKLALRGRRLGVVNE